MGLFSKAKNAVKLASIPFSKAPGDKLAKYFQRLLGMKAAPERGDRELLKAYSSSPNLRMVQSKVSYGVASVPWTLYKKKGPGGKAIKDKSLSSAGFESRKKMIKQMEIEGKLEKIDGHPLLDALNDGNEYLTGLQSRLLTQSWVDMLGDAFWIKERNGMGMPTTFYPIPRIWVTDSPFVSGSDHYTISMPNGSTFNVPTSEVVAFVDPDPLNPYSGFGSGYGRALADEIDTDEYASKHIKNFFHNDARPEMLVTGKDMSKDQAKRIKEKWKEELQGFKKAYLPYFMKGEGVSVTQIGRSFRDMELVELRKNERDIVKSVYGVPPEVLGIVENSNRATIQAAKAIMAEFVTIPRLELMRSILQARLVPDYDDRIILDYISPLPEDKESKQEMMKEHEWAFTKNEIRNAAGHQSVDDGDGFGQRPANQQQTPQKIHKKKGITKQDDPIDEDIIDDVIEAIEAGVLIQGTQELYKKIVSEVGADVFSDLPVDQIEFDPFSPTIEEYIINEVGEKIRGINETTINEIREQHLISFREDEGINKFADRINKVFGRATETRSKIIAQTETMQSTNFANYSAYKDSDVVEKKEWISSRDEKVRPSHIEADGQIVGIDEYFITGLGNKTMYPGNTGVAEDDIYERCTMAAVFDNKTYLDTEEKRYDYWKKQDNMARSYEDEMANAYVQSFNNQLKSVMQVLDSYRG